MNDRLAKTISFFFHPIAIPSYSILVFFCLRSFISTRVFPELKLWVIGTVIITTIIIPSIFVYFFIVKGIVKSGYMETRHERTIPYFITSIFFFLAFYLIKAMPLPQTYELFMLGATTIIIAAFIINFWWKISIHMTAIGGMLGAFIAISYIFLTNTLIIQIIIILCSGIIGASRLQLKAHHPSQIYIGFVLGLVIMMGVFLLLT